jgi:hypothetical protein
MRVLVIVIPLYPLIDLRIRNLKLVPTAPPPARKHLVRHYGALGPRSPLRRAVSIAARGKATADELEAGCGGEMKLAGGDFRRPRTRPDIGASKLAGGISQD